MNTIEYEVYIFICEPVVKPCYYIKGILLLINRKSLNYTIQNLQASRQMMIEVSEKRELFRSQIRSKQVSSMLSSLRAKISKQQRTHMLTTLAQSIENRKQIYKQELVLLASWCKEGDGLAMAYFGNFVIDEILSLQRIHQFNVDGENYLDVSQWKGDKQQVLWLLHILYEKGSFDFKHLLCLIQLISSKVNRLHKQLTLSSLSPQSFVYQHGLYLLRVILRQYSAAGQLLLDPTSKKYATQILKSLYLIVVNGPCNKLMATALSILNCLSQTEIKDKDCSLLTLYNCDKLIQIIQIGLKRVQTPVRCQIIQIINNIYLQDKYQSEKLMMAVLPDIVNGWVKEKTSVKLEISYMLLNFCQQCNLASLIQLLIDEKLLNILEELRSQLINNENHIELFNNIMKILLHIHKNREQFELHGSNLQLSYLFSQELNTVLHHWLTQHQNFQN